MVKQKKYIDQRMLFLKGIIDWRDITDIDIDVSGVCDSICGLNDDEIFPRNAASRLFRYYYKLNSVDNVRFLIKYMIKNLDRWYLHFARSIDQYAIFASKHSFVDEALGYCIKFLEKCSIEVSGTPNRPEIIGIDSIGDSHDWSCIILGRYLKLLIDHGEKEKARSLIASLLYLGKLRPDTEIYFENLARKCKSNVKKQRVKLPEIVIPYRIQVNNKGQKIELTALEYLENSLGYIGFYAEVEVWRAIFSLIDEDSFSDSKKGCFLRNLGTLLGYQINPLIYDFGFAHRSLFSKLSDMLLTGKYTNIGFPDLILFKPDDINDFVFVEVKSRGDKLSPHQQAWAEFFLNNGIPYKLAKFK